MFFRGNGNLLSVFPDQCFEKTWCAGGEVQHTARDGMFETERAGVETDPSGLGRLSSVFPVAGDRMSDVFHVGADLVFTSGFQFEFHERVAGPLLHDPVAGDSRGAFAVGRHVHLELAVFLERSFDTPFLSGYSALHNGHVGAFADDALPVFLKRFLNRFAFGEEHQSGSLAVEAVDDEDHGAGIVPFHMATEDMVGRPFLFPVGAH